MAKLGGLLVFCALSSFVGYAAWSYLWPLSIIFFHLSANFFMATIGMFLHTPRMFGKRKDGSLPWWAFLLWWPWILLAWLSARHTQGRMMKYPLLSAVHDRIYVGGYLGFHPLPVDLLDRDIAVIDVTCELPRSSALWHSRVSYLNIGTWDGTPPTVQNLRDALAWSLPQYKAGKSLFIHCAFGIGRSATVACAVLVALGVCGTWEEAFEYMKKQRGVIKLNAGYKGALVKWTKSLSANAGSTTKQ
eukprot:TRINITY_DN14821_c0_g1_i1.p1 TRINITY_DN14821_c0_g1~~TRINITY_DN14821_c0_g1_i1.p1  ORF type:complete len:271 (+),score=11.50 TRINITY_DN14821_c0_g1_i1:77-814(+)